MVLALHQLHEGRVRAQHRVHLGRDDCCAAVAVAAVDGFQRGELLPGHPPDEVADVFARAGREAD